MFTTLLRNPKNLPPLKTHCSMDFSVDISSGFFLLFSCACKRYKRSFESLSSFRALPELRPTASAGHKLAMLRSTCFVCFSLSSRYQCLPAVTLRSIFNCLHVLLNLKLSRANFLGLLFCWSNEIRPQAGVGESLIRNIFGSVFSRNSIFCGVSQAGNHSHTFDSYTISRHANRSDKRISYRNQSGPEKSLEGRIGANQKHEKRFFTLSP